MIIHAQSCQEIFIKNPWVFRQMLNFNFNPASYLHDSRRSKFFENKIPDSVWDNPRVHTRLSGLMLSSLELTQHTFFEPSYSLWPLISLPTKRFLRLAHHIGAIAVGTRIRSSLARSQVLDWKSQLGEEAYKFAMKSSQLLPSIKIQGIPTGIKAAEILGYGLIFSCFEDAPQPVKQRVQLKIPHEAEKFTTDKRQANHIVQSVITTLETEWHSLFVEIRS